MQVIAGEFKGRKLKSVPGKNTRPTSDKVKEAVFQMIGPFFTGGTCLDLFAGSGALGIEALSRGIDYAVFIEKNGQAIRTIYENIKLLNIEKQTEVSRMDAFRALRVMEKNQACFDVIFIDPPYMENNYEKLMSKMMEGELLKAGGIIYCEHDAKIELPSNFNGLQMIKRVNYGGTIGITIYRN